MQILYLIFNILKSNLIPFLSESSSHWNSLGTMGADEQRNKQLFFNIA